MQEKYKNKYRIESNRMPRWDYSGDGVYFITIVIQNRKCILGEIKNNKMILSDFGKIIEPEWHKSFKIRHELFSDEFIIMPNHLHAIIILKKSKNENINQSYHPSHEPQQPHVETHGRASLQSTNQLIRLPKSISSFVGGFKSIINSRIDDYIDENNLNIPKYNRNNHFFQPNYHDRIIRDDIEYQRIKQYIIENPLNWNIDRFYE